MKINIIVYSQTGQTMTVARKIEEKLNAGGHSAVINALVPQEEVRPDIKELHFETLPKVDEYEGILFASPVMAFSLAPPMKIFLSQVESLHNKKVAFLIAKQLPFYWTGANQAKNWMTRKCKKKGAVVLGSGVVIWSSKEKEKKIIEVVDSLSGLF